MRMPILAVLLLLLSFMFSYGSNSESVGLDEGPQISVSVNTDAEIVNTELSFSDNLEFNVVAETNIAISSPILNLKFYALIDNFRRISYQKELRVAKIPNNDYTDIDLHFIM